MAKQPGGLKQDAFARGSVCFDGSRFLADLGGPGVVVS
jgi:hypothetical protein